MWNPEESLMVEKEVKLPDEPSIAVLPFENMSGDPEQEYFSDGLTEEIITGLSKLPHLFVIARNSTFTYKGKAVKVQQVSREMGAKYILEGKCAKCWGASADNSAAGRWNHWATSLGRSL